MFAGFHRGFMCAAKGDTMVRRTADEWCGWWAGFAYRANCVRLGRTP